MAATRIRLNAAQLKKVANTAGHRTNAAISDATGINQPTLSRMLNGHETPSARSISAILATYPEWTFEELFTVESDDETQPATAALAAVA